MKKFVFRASNLLPLISSFAVLLAIGWGIFGWHYGFHPPIGTYVAILGALAAAVTFWPTRKRWVKTCWVMVFFLLTFFEIRNLLWDRSEHEKEFQSMVAKMSDTLGQLTGGDTYCYFMVAPNLGSGNPVTYPLSVWVRGKYPMRSASSQIQTLLNRNQVQMISLPLGDGTLLPGVRSIGYSIGLGRHSISTWSVSGGPINEIIDLSIDSHGALDQEIEVWGDGKQLFKEGNKDLGFAKLGK